MSNSSSSILYFLLEDVDNLCDDFGAVTVMFSNLAC